MSRPIPRRLLPHSISHYVLDGVDSWNKPAYSDATTVSYTRVEFTKKNLLNSQGENKDDKAILFIDKKNSVPRVDYSKGDKVVYKGESFTIREIIEECGDSEEVHHLEIALV